MSLLWKIDVSDAVNFSFSDGGYANGSPMHPLGYTTIVLFAGHQAPTQELGGLLGPETQQGLPMPPVQSWFPQAPRLTLHQNPATNLAHHFEETATGNLHLYAPLPEAIGPVEVANGVVDDIDRRLHRGRPMPGADEPTP